VSLELFEEVSQARREPTAIPQTNTPPTHQHTADQLIANQAKAITTMASSNASVPNNEGSAAPAAAPKPPTEEMANLHLDEVTGEWVSKTELKKRQKQRQREADKAAKAAAAPKPTAKPKVAGGDEEKDLNPNQYYEIRTRHVAERMYIEKGGTYVKSGR